MNVIAAAQTYIAKVIDGSGIKVLLLDADTTPIISLVTTQSALLENEVYLVDKLANRTRERMRHLKCLVFVRPTIENVELLVSELREPRYGSYNLIFTNILAKDHLERLAESDEQELIKSVYEYYLDYFAMNNELFYLGIKTQYSSPNWSPKVLDRTTQGVISIMLALKKRCVIRYEKNSQLAHSLASSIQRIMDVEDKLFTFPRNDTPPVLLILDRKNDPITPLLTQWTYQAMVHEELGIHNGRVKLGDGEIVLTPDADPFFASNMFLNFGDLGSVIKAYVESYQLRTTNNKKLESVSDMKKFIEDYPEFRKLSGNVSKHVSLMSELSKSVEKRQLLDVSELEQSLACNDTHTNDLKTLQGLITDDAIDVTQKLRVTALYALRYERHPQNATQILMGLLNVSGVSKSESKVIDAILTHMGQSRRQEELFSDDSFFSRARSGIKGLQGVENVYTQHRPLLEQTLQSLSKARLSEQKYPYFKPTTRGEKPQDVIIYMLGGTTYEEAKVVREFNSSTPGLRIILGGDEVLDSKRFMGRFISDDSI